MDANLHEACRENNEELIQYLISHGADVLSIDGFGKTPIELIDPEKENYYQCVEPIIAEAAKLKFEEKNIPKEINSIIVTDDYLLELFQESLVELDRMKTTTFYKIYSYYSILKMYKKKK